MANKITDCYLRGERALAGSSRFRRLSPGYRRGLRHVATWLVLSLLGFVAAQGTRQIYTGPSGGGIFNLAVNTPVLLGEEAFAVSLLESGSTMQLRRTPYSTVSYRHAGVGEGGTLHLQRRLRWPERNIDRTLELRLKLDTPLAFATGYGGHPGGAGFPGGPGRAAARQGGERPATRAPREHRFLRVTDRRSFRGSCLVPRRRVTRARARRSGVDHPVSSSPTADIKPN